MVCWVRFFCFSNYNYNYFLLLLYTAVRTSSRVDDAKHVNTGKECVCVLFVLLHKPEEDNISAAAYY